MHGHNALILEILLQDRPNFHKIKSNQGHFLQRFMNNINFTVSPVFNYVLDSDLLQHVGMSFAKINGNLKIYNL